MQPSDFCFCVHDGSIEGLGEEEGDFVITFCPAEYWHEHKCLPDYYFADEVDVFLPKEPGYNSLWGFESAHWITKKAPDVARAELVIMGFVFSQPMDDFLTPLWDEHYYDDTFGKGNVGDTGSHGA